MREKVLEWIKKEKIPRYCSMATNVPDAGRFCHQLIWKCFPAVPIAITSFRTVRNLNNSFCARYSTGGSPTVSTGFQDESDRIFPGSENIRQIASLKFPLSRGINHGDDTL